MVVLGGSLTVAGGLFDDIEGFGGGNPLVDNCNGRAKSDFSYSAILEKLLNEHFPCHKEADPSGEEGGAGDAATGHHHRLRRHRHHRSGDAGDAGGPPAPPRLTSAQRKGRHIVHNAGRGATGSYHWVEEMSRWMNSPMGIRDNPFDEGADLVRSRPCPPGCASLC